MSWHTLYFEPGLMKNVVKLIIVQELVSVTILTENGHFAANKLSLVDILEQHMTSLALMS